MLFQKDRLYELGGVLPDDHFKWDKKKAAAEKAGVTESSSEENTEG